MKIEKLAITALQCHLTIVTHWLCNKLNNMKQTLDTEELGLQCVGVNKLFTEICELLHHKLKGRSCVHVIAKWKTVYVSLLQALEQLGSHDNMLYSITTQVQFCAATYG